MKVISIDSNSWHHWELHWEICWSFGRCPGTVLVYGWDGAWGDLHNNMYKGVDKADSVGISARSKIHHYPPTAGKRRETVRYLPTLDNYKDDMKLVQKIVLVKKILIPISILVDWRLLASCLISLFSWLRFKFECDDKWSWDPFHIPLFAWIYTGWHSDDMLIACRPVQNAKMATFSLASCAVRVYSIGYCHVTVLSKRQASGPYQIVRDTINTMWCKESTAYQRNVVAWW